MELLKKEKRDLNMISKAYFDLFSGNKPRPSKTQLAWWVHQHHAHERAEEEKKKHNR